MLWRKTLIYWRSLAVVCAIAYVCLLREPRVTLPQITGVDKWLHGMMYLVLALVMMWDPDESNGQVVRKLPALTPSWLLQNREALPDAVS